MNVCLYIRRYYFETIKISLTIMRWRVEFLSSFVFIFSLFVIDREIIDMVWVVRCTKFYAYFCNNCCPQTSIGDVPSTILTNCVLSRNIEAGKILERLKTLSRFGVRHIKLLIAYVFKLQNRKSSSDRHKGH